MGISSSIFFDSAYAILACATGSSRWKLFRLLGLRLAHFVIAPAAPELLYVSPSAGCSQVLTQISTTPLGFLSQDLSGPGSRSEIEEFRSKPYRRKRFSSSFFAIAFADAE